MHANMPKIGPYAIPNHDIEKIVEAIEEVPARAGEISPGDYPEETFQEDMLSRKGGSYQRHRFDLQLYGFLQREHGADEVTLTELFADVANPVEAEDKEYAIKEAVKNVEIFEMLKEAGISPEDPDQKYRVWLNKDLNLPRDQADSDTVDKLRNLYKPAAQYLEVDTEDETENAEVETDHEQSESSTEDGSREPREDMEEISVGEKLVRLPKEDMGSEWDELKAGVDAILKARGVDVDSDE